MLTDADRIALDRRGFHQAILEEVRRIESHPAIASVSRGTKKFAEDMIELLRGQSHLAIADEGLRLLEEVKCYERVLARFDTDLIAHGEGQIEQRQSAAREPASRHTGQFPLQEVVNGKPNVIDPDSTRDGEAHNELMKHRRRILKAYMREQQLAGMEALARKLGTCTTALHGMIREDKTRYSTERRDSVLKQIGCSHTEWNQVSISSKTA